MKDGVVAAIVLVGLVGAGDALVFGGVIGGVFGVGVTLIVVGGGVVHQILLPPGYYLLFHGLVVVGS